jgi:O-antigen ligase
MSLRLYSKLVLICFSFVFLLGTVWSTYIYPLTGISVGSYYDLKRHLVLGFVVFISALALFLKSVIFVRLSSITTWFIVLFFLLGGVSTALSDKPFWGAVELANYFILFALFLMLSISISSLDKRQVYQGVYYTVLVFSLFLFVQFLLSLIFNLVDGNEPSVHELVSGFVNARFLNQLQVMVIPLLFFPFFISNLFSFKRISVFLLAFHWMMLFQTEARGAGLSLAVAASLVIYFSSKEFRSLFIKPLISSLAVGILFWCFFILLLPYLFTGESGITFRTSSSGRWEMWVYIVDRFMEHPWLGHGSMSFAWAHDQPLSNAHPHNFILQLLYENGVFLVVAVCLLVVRSLVREFIKLESLKNEGCLLLLAISSALIYSMFSGVFVMPMAQVLFVFLIGVYAVSFDECCVVININRYIKYILLIAIISLSAFVLSTYKHEALMENVYPRLWASGQIK